MKSLQAQFSFCQPLMLSTASASAKTCLMWCNRISCFGCFVQNMVFSNVKKKQAKYEQEVQKLSFQPSWQSKRPWFSLVPGISVSANSRNYGHDVLGDW